MHALLRVGLLTLLFSLHSLAVDEEPLQIEMKDGSKYVFTQSSQELPESIREQFLINRAEILKRAAQTLHGLRIPIGVWKKSIRPKLDWLYGKSSPLDDADLNFQETGFVSIQKALSDLDKHLWEKSESVSKANEYGVALEVGLSGGAKAGVRGLYGITGLGMLVTVDPIEKAVVLELFGDFELTQRATPFYGGAGAFLTIMGNAVSTDWQKKLCAESGSAFCASGLVGFISNRYLGLGVSKELGLGFPGAVLMESNLSRFPFLRIGASPQWPGFIRAQTALGPAIETVFKQVKEALSKTCSNLLSRLK